MAVAVVDGDALTGRHRDASIAAAALSDLVGAIYQCVLDPQAWPATLSLLRGALGFHNASIALHDLARGHVLVHASDGIDPAWLARIPAYADDVIALWGGPEAYATLPLLEPIILSHVAGEGMADNRYYREWALPQGLVDVVGLGLVRDAASLGSIGFGWHGSAGRIGTREIGLLRLLTPHLHRAVSITQLLEARQLVNHAIERMFDTIQSPVVIVDTELIVVHANAAARRAFEMRSPFHVHNRRLVASRVEATTALQRAVQRFEHKSWAVDARTLGIPVPGSGCLLHLFPLDAHGKPHQTLAAVFVASSARQPRAARELVRALYQLTEAEAVVFEHIANGDTVAATAAHLGVRQSTVRSHLLRVFQKTDTARQSELALLGAALAAPVGLV